MIIPPTKSFFVIQLKGEAIDLLMNKLSPSTTSDIREAIIISDDYSEDIEAHTKMDVALAKLQAELGDLSVQTTYNPLYVPSTVEQIDSILEGEPGADNFRFTGMDGNPFTMKSITMSSGEEQLIQAKVSCHQFDLPSYHELLDGQQNVRIQ